MQYLVLRINDNWRLAITAILLHFNKVKIMSRITVKDLQTAIEVINSKITDKIKLSQAYDGFKVERSQGHNDVLATGFISKAELYKLLQAFNTGLYERDKDS
jgi:hypothetical protein